MKIKTEEFLILEQILTVFNVIYNCGLDELFRFELLLGNLTKAGN